MVPTSRIQENSLVVTRQLSTDTLGTYQLSTDTMETHPQWKIISFGESFGM